MQEHERAMLISWGQHHYELKVRQLAEELQRMILAAKRRKAVRQTSYVEIQKAVQPWK